MKRIRVHKLGPDQLDWAMTCYEHRERVWTGTWADAYEAAAGHAVMFHPRQKAAA